MTTIKVLKKPNYTYWASADFWTLTDATFLLNDVDPELFEHDDDDAIHRFESMVKKYPAYTELGLKIQNIYLQLKTIDWQLSPYGFSLHDAKHPFAVIYEAYYQNLIQSDAPLFIEVNKLCQATEGHSLISDALKSNDRLSDRERDHLLTALGLLATILSEKVSRYQKGEQPNALQIKEAICEKAARLGLESTGLESINRKIRDGLYLIKAKTTFN